MPRAVPASSVRIAHSGRRRGSQRRGSQGEGARGAPSKEGPYGGIEAQLLSEPRALTHSDICSASGVTNCSTSAPIGGGFAAYAGYTVAPVGIDAMFGFQADAAGVHGKVAGMAEALTIPRVGGVFAVRGRLAWDSPSFGASLRRRRRSRDPRRRGADRRRCDIEGVRVAGDRRRRCALRALFP